MKVNFSYHHSVVKTTNLAFAETVQVYYIFAGPRETHCNIYILDAVNNIYYSYI